MNTGSIITAVLVGSTVVVDAAPHIGPWPDEWVSDNGGPGERIYGCRWPIVDVTLDAPAMAARIQRVWGRRLAEAFSADHVIRGASTDALSDFVAAVLADALWVIGTSEGQRRENWESDRDALQLSGVAVLSEAASVITDAVEAQRQGDEGAAYRAFRQVPALMEQFRGIQRALVDHLDAEPVR